MSLAPTQIECLTYLVVFQAEVGDTTHWRRLAFGEILVHLIDTFRDVVVSAIEEVTSTGVYLSKQHWNTEADSTGVCEYH
jgi:hypothetical protein